MATDPMDVISTVLEAVGVLVVFFIVIWILASLIEKWMHS